MAAAATINQQQASPVLRPRSAASQPQQQSKPSLPADRPAEQHQAPASPAINRRNSSSNAQGVYFLPSAVNWRKSRLGGNDDHLANESINELRHAADESVSAPGGRLEAQSHNFTQTECQGSPSLTTQYIGMTTELEPLLLDYLPLDQNCEGQLAASRIRKFSDDGTYMRMVDVPHAGPELPSISVEAIENLVTPFGPSLIEKFFQNIHPTFPVLMEDSFRSLYQSRSVPPVLLASIYLVSLKWLDPGPGIQTLRKPDAARLESTALKLLNDSFVRPHLAAIQAGLLLSQKSALFSPRLISQLVTAAFDIGLHQDCSTWRIESWEKGLRKRLAWALYVQDKWCALTHGQPSHIFTQNWTVQELSLDDFENCYSKGPNSTTRRRTPGLFSFLASSLSPPSSPTSSTHSTRSAPPQDFSHAGDQSTRIILERAKPHPAPPEELITLHRCIIRSINPNHTDDYLIHICRSAAKTRLISAMNFVNRLRPNHLRAFWPAAARTNFALIVAFGMLLRITAQTREEEEFYRCRLGEYRWTLEVSRRHAAFLGWVVECLDVMSSVIRGVGLRKPKLEEYMARSIMPAVQGGRWANLREPHTAEDDKGSVSGNSFTTRRGYDQSLLSSSTVVSGLASPSTSVSGGSRRGSRSGLGQGQERSSVMNVVDLA
ncbi:TamA [Coccidioides immitis RMSCC 3703]|uniref:TamA n=1 Tax=Coccidioides immitis RMSCC 3703 TaxID=454286 RepID=A0A0J8TS90_COCIT|nr:TamA [Coccidioides immitis RMSCC 3703]